MASLPIDSRSIGAIDSTLPNNLPVSRGEQRDSFQTHLRSDEDDNSQVRKDAFEESPGANATTDSESPEAGQEHEQAPLEDGDQPADHNDAATIDSGDEKDDAAEVTIQTPLLVELTNETPVESESETVGTAETIVEPELSSQSVEIVLDEGTAANPVANVDPNQEPAAVSRTSADGAATERSPDRSAAAQEQISAEDLLEDAGSKPANQVTREVSGERVASLPLTDSAAARQATGGVETEANSVERKADSQSPIAQTGNGSTEAGGTKADTPAGRFAEQLLPRAADHNERSEQLDSAQQMRFVDRVARAFQAAEGRGTPLRLRLNPPELGSLRLELRVQNGALTARVEAETSSARSLLLENLPLLRERLTEQGVRIEQFEVDLNQQRYGGTAENANHDSGRSEDSEQPAQQSVENAEEEPTGSSQLQTETSPDQIDIVI